MPEGAQIGPEGNGGSTGGGGSGTVTSVSVVTANGLSGSVATATSTPAITLTATPQATFTETAQSSTYTAANGQIVLCTAGAGGFTVTLPSPTAGNQVVVKKVDNAAGSITIAPNPNTGTIDGQATIVFSVPDQSYWMVADGTNWWVIAQNPLAQPNYYLTVTASSTVASASVGTYYRCTGTFTLTLPANPPFIGAWVLVKNIGTGTITVQSSGHTIDGNSTVAMAAQYSSYMFIWNNPNWDIN